MRKSIAPLTLAAVAAFASTARAAPAITVGSHPLTSVSPTQTDTFDVFYDTALSGGGPMHDQTIYISIADEGNGGLGTADPGEPKIVSVDGVTGTVWASNNTGPNYTTVNNQVWSVDVSVSTVFVSATGRAFSIAIDRNDAPISSTWDLRVFINVPDLGGPYASNWSNGDATAPFQGSNGTFQYVPEPTSIVMGAFAIAGLAVAAIRKHRSTH